MAWQIVGLSPISSTENNLFQLTAIKEYGIPDSSDFDPLLVLIYIKDLNNAVKYCNAHHFGDDTN